MTWLRRLGILLRLIPAFLKGAVLSGWDTARVILQPPGRVHPGLMTLRYGELSPGAASLLAALITLTPGTTVVNIDLDHREFLLHLLDLEAYDANRRAIEDDLIRPLRRWSGGQHAPTA